MAKYSTGNSGSSKDNSNVCELCGEKNTNCEETKIESAVVIACRNCRPEESNKESEKYTSKSKNKKQNNFNNENDKTSSGYTITRQESEWAEESRTDYGNVQTPRLVNNYSDIVKKSIDNKENAANELNIRLKSIEALIESDAIKHGVSEEEIVAVEEHYNIDIRAKSL